MSSMRQENAVVYLFLKEIIHQSTVIISCVIEYINKKEQRKRLRSSIFSIIDRIPYQVTEMERFVGRFNSDYFENLQMDRNTFDRLCLLLRDLD